MRNRVHEIGPAADVFPPVDVVIESTLAGKSLELLQRSGLSEMRLTLVCDSNTRAAMAERIAHELSPASVTLVTLEHPHADDQTVKSLRIHHSEAFIAVGSGTISDLCKYASFLEHVPYVVFPTAPSMNGYLSANASITRNGVKRTFPAHLPKGVFCDLQILSQAPMRLIRSGLGDSICRSTAQADWLLSHLLLGTSYNPLPFAFLEPYENDLLTSGEALSTRKHYAIELLIRTLLASGMGMVIAGGSYPASQGEHLLAHTMEMKFGNRAPYSFHGEQIGVTTLIMAALQRDVIRKPVRLRRHSNWLDTAVDYFGESAREEILHAGRQKFEAIINRIDEINDLLTTERNHLRDTIEQVMRPPEVLKNALLSAGAPTTPEEIGWNQEDINTALHHACYLRDRFTFLDLV